MKYFLDTEFIEDGKTIDLVSIGIVAEDGREFYAVNRDHDPDKASEWVKENVIVHLPSKDEVRMFIEADGTREIRHTVWLFRDDIGVLIRRFIGADVPEFWAYYADYDWVALCQIYGTMMELPQHWPMYCRDIKQWCDQLGNPALPKQETTAHDALEDARWVRDAWRFLQQWGESTGEEGEK